MRIVLDTGDLRQLASEANRATQRVHSVRSAVQRERSAVDLNTRDDARLRRVSPDEDARRILAEMDRLEDDYRALSRSYEAKARAVEQAERVPWRPFIGSIGIGSIWRVPLRWSSPLGPNPFGTISQIGRAVGGFVGTAQRSIASVGRGGASLVQRGFGFLRRGFDSLLRGFTNVAGKLIETVAGAWSRIWNRTQTLLQSVIGGIRDIVAFSGRVIVGATTAVVTTVGRFVSSAAKKPWHFLGRLWDGLTWGAGKLFTALDMLEVISSIEKLMSIPAKLAEWAGHVGAFFKKIPKINPLVHLVIGGISAVVDFVRYGLGDARFWRSTFEAVAGIAISFASKAATVVTVGGKVVAAVVVGKAAAVAAAAGLTLWASMWFGGKLSDWFFMPLIRRIGEEDERRIEAETEAFIRNLPRKYNPNVGQDPVGGLDLSHRDDTLTVVEEAFEESAASIEARFRAEYKPVPGSNYDRFNFEFNASGNCTSYVAWRLNDLADRAGHSQFSFDNNAVTFEDGSTVHYGRLGNAHEWLDSAKAAGIAPSTTPQPGSVLVWEVGDGKAFRDGRDFGHVAIVKEVRADGSIVIEDSAYGSDLYRETTLAADEYPKKFLNFLP